MGEESEGERHVFIDTGTGPECSCHDSGITIPIIPGIMPIQTYASFLRLTKLCGTRVPVQVMADLAEIRVSLFKRIHGGRCSNVQL